MIDDQEKMTCRLALFAALLVAAGLLAAPPVHAQQKVGYVDSDEILRRTPEYATVEQQVGRLAEQWESELRQEERALEELRVEYQARELLYTDEERRAKEEEIARAEEDIERLEQEYFGPEGKLYTEEERLLRPVQERVLTAIEEVARAEGYDYVLDQSGALVFLFAREQYDLTADVLEELGIDVGQQSRSGE